MRRLIEYRFVLSLAASAVVGGLGLHAWPFPAELGDDWSVSRGGRQAWRQFDDQFLTYDGQPISMVRRQIMGNARGSLF